MQNKAYVAIIALVAYVVAIVTISSKCQGPQQQQQNAKAATLGRFQLLSTDCECDTGSKRNSNSINSSGRWCDGNELEDYFKVRFHEEIQNLVNGNETEYGRQIKMIQSQRMKEDLEIRLREMKQEFESKLSSVESDSQQRIFDMKKIYCEYGSCIQRQFQWNFFFFTIGVWVYGVLSWCKGSITIV